MGFPGGSVVKTLPATAGDTGPIPGWGSSFLWKRKWQSTSVFLPGKSHGQRGLVGYHPWGCKELNTIEHAHTHTHTHTHTLQFPPVHSNPDTLTCGLAASCLLDNGMAQDITDRSFKWLVRAVSLLISQPPLKIGNSLLFYFALLINVSLIMLHSAISRDMWVTLHMDR